MTYSLKQSKGRNVVTLKRFIILLLMVSLNIGQSFAFEISSRKQAEDIIYGMDKASAESVRAALDYIGPAVTKEPNLLIILTGKGATYHSMLLLQENLSPEQRKLSSILDDFLVKYGDIESKYSIASFYDKTDKGFGWEDSKKAFKIYAELSDRGHPESIVRLSKMYRDGDGVVADEYKAFELLTPLAKSNNVEALSLLAEYYKNGVGTNANTDSAIRMYKRIIAVDTNHNNYRTTHTIGSLAHLYLSGEGVLQNFSESFKWYSLAASKKTKFYERGFPPAQFMVGVMYGGGLGVKQDNVKAHMWLNLAAANGYSNAAEERDKLRMTPSELATAQKMARNWKPTP